MEFMANSKMSLVNKIMTLFIGTLILVMFLYSVMVFTVNHFKVQNINDANALDVAQLEAEMVDQWFEDSMTTLRSLGFLGTEGSLEDGSYIDGLKVVQQQYADRFRLLFVVDLSKNENNYRDTMGVEGTASTDDPVISRIMAGEDYVVLAPEMNVSLNEMVMRVIVPLRENGNLIGILGTMMSMEDLSNRLDTFEVNDAGFGWLVDEQYTVMAHPELDLIMSMTLLEEDAVDTSAYVNAKLKHTSDLEYENLIVKEGETPVRIHYADSDNYRRTVTFEPIEFMPGWKVAFTSFDDKEPSASTTLLLFMAIGLLIATVVSIIISYVFARDITKPINKLIHVVTLFTEGNKGVRFTSKANDEIGTLAKAFNGMADTIIEHTDNVEELIQERTQLLTDLNYQIVVRNKELDTMNKELETTNDKLHALATTDMLTGLQNRHDLVRTLQGFIDEVIRGEEAGFSILFVDLDNFKYYNDTFSHEIGDYLLVEVAKILKSNVRDNDVVARYGGDEFVIVLKHGDFDTSKMLSERVHAKILERQGFKKEIERRIGTEIKLLGKNKLSSSIGIVNYNKNTNAKNVDELLALADETMYKAKKAGKSRIVVH